MNYIRLWRYYIDFVVFPPLVAWAAWEAFRDPLQTLLLFAGMILWTFNEYWVHRSVLHRYFWHGTHERHHNEPEEFVETIWWYTPVLGIVSYPLLPLGLWAGFWAGYVWFLCMHHMLHHRALTPGTWLYQYARWHGLHHKFGDCNYGITMNWWDRVFGTSVQPGRRI